MQPRSLIEALQARSLERGASRRAFLFLDSHVQIGGHSLLGLQVLLREIFVDVLPAELATAEEEWQT